MTAYITKIDARDTATLRADAPVSHNEPPKSASLTCDCCYHAAPLDKIHKVADYVYLCDSCFTHVDRMKQGALRSCIERQLLGNFI